MDDVSSVQLPTFGVEIETLAPAAQLGSFERGLPEGARILTLPRLPNHIGPRFPSLLFWSALTASLSKESVRQAADLLQAEINRVNGAWLAVNGLDSPVPLKPVGIRWVASMKPLKVTEHVLLSEPAYMSAQTVGFRKLSAGGSESDELSKWFLLSEGNNRIALGLRALSAASLDWFALWKVFELAEVIVSNATNARPLWTASKPYVTEEECWRFRVAANDPLAWGEHARHAVGKGKPDGPRLNAMLNPMSLWEARAWILKLWRRLVFAASQDPANFYLEPPSPTVTRQYRTDGRGTLIVMSVDNDLDRLWGDGMEYAKSMLDKENA